MTARVVFHTLNHSENAAKVMDETDQLLKSAKSPLFLNVFIFNWGIKPADLVQLKEHLASQGVVIVAPENLGQVYKEYKATFGEQGAK